MKEKFMGILKLTFITELFNLHLYAVLLSVITTKSNHQWALRDLFLKFSFWYWKIAVKRECL